MKNIITDYVETLKEEVELENLILNIIALEGHRDIIPPQKGTRQYGSDISSVKNNEKFYFVIKRGNFDRNNWDNSTTSIRQTINQLVDVHISDAIKKRYSTINIVVCYNGIFKQEVEFEWNGFQQKTEKDHKVNLIKWSNNEIADLMIRHLTETDFLNSDLRSDVRKTLYFLDEVDFDLFPFKKLILNLLSSIKDSKKKPLYKKKSVMLTFIVGLCFSYARKLDNNRIAIKMSEFVLINYWSFLIKNDLLEKEFENSRLQYYYRLYTESSNSYIENISKVALLSPSFSASNTLEYKILTYECIGLIATFTLSEIISYAPITLKAEKMIKIKNNIGLITHIIKNNPSFYYPPYDLNSIEVDILMILLTHSGNKDIAKNLILDISNSVHFSINSLNKYPVEYENFEKAVQIEYGKVNPEFIATNILSSILDWLQYYEHHDQVQKIVESLDKKYSNLTYNYWSIGVSDEENYLSKNDIMFGEALTYKKITRENIDEVSEIISKPKSLTSIQYSFTEILLITARHSRKPVLRHLLMDVLSL